LAGWNGDSHSDCPFLADQKITEGVVMFLEDFEIDEALKGPGEIGMLAS
jgi:hypothetical protein